MAACLRKRAPPPIPLAAWESARVRSSNDRERKSVENNERLGKEYIMVMMRVNGRGMI